MRVQINSDGPLLWVTLNSPERANALDRVTVARLLEVLDKAERDGTTRALVLTGAGHIFCAGADLSELLSGTSDQLRSFMESLRELTTRIERSPLVVIASVNGAARAGGIELALACDVIIAGQSASFGDAHLARNLLPAGGSTARLPRVIGWQRAKWLILSGNAIDAKTAADWGLVLQIVEDGDLANATGQLAKSLIRADGQTLGKAKKLLAMVGEQPMTASLEAEIAALEAHYYSDAFRSGIQSFFSNSHEPE